MLFKTCIRGNIQYEMIKKVSRKIKRILKKELITCCGEKFRGIIVSSQKLAHN